MSEQQIITPEVPENSQQKQEAKRKKEYEANRKALDELCLLYPEVFDGAKPKPLQIGIHEAIATDGKLSKTRIRRALNLYVRMRSYVAALTENAERITLGGAVTGKVSTEEASHALEKLTEIDRKRALKRPAAGKSKGPRKNARKPTPSGDRSQKTANTKSVIEPSAVAKPVEQADSGERMQNKLAALVNKRSN